MISAEQTRAARALLGWSQGDLADKSGVAARTLGKIEDGAGAKKSIMANVETAFTQAGVEFLPGHGVRMRPREVVEFLGEGAYSAFLDDIFATLRDQDAPEVLITGAKEPDENSPRRAALKEHIERLLEAGITERILIEEGDTNFVAPAHWYRWLPSEFFNRVAFQCYGDKLALTAWGPPARVLVIEDPLWASTMRSLFDFVWDRSVLPPQGGGA